MSDKPTRLEANAMTLDGRILIDGVRRRTQDERISDGKKLEEIIKAAQERLAKSKTDNSYECEAYS